mmetsp:Transcript_20897/g.24118  ORF Transcript_20897/g.24118 Transcript_20897/m.24118 type:complete len:681 (+) Transcript_20897:164-2206(+)
MKFVQATIALVAAIASSSFGATTATSIPKEHHKKRAEYKKKLDHRMKNGLFDKATLMRGAQPHSPAAKEREEKRKLQYELEITGSFSVQFQSCFSLTQSYADIFDADEDGGTKMMLMQNGALQPLQSYAIFRLCYNNVCGANGNQAMLDYVVDLSTYVQALVNYLPEQMEEFCEGCMENYDSCIQILYGSYAQGYDVNNAYNYRQSYNAGSNNYNGNQENNVNYNTYSGSSSSGNQQYQNQQQGQQYNDGQQQSYNGGYGNSYNGGYNNANANANNNNANNNYNGGRKARELHDFQKRVLENGQVVKQLNCNLCQEYNCLSEDEDEYGELYGFEVASEWLQEMAECTATEITYTGGSNNGNANYNNYNNNDGDDSNLMYTGFICNADGNGVEIGMFLDEECVLYLPNESYMNYMSYFDQTYAAMTEEIVEFTFSTAVLSCKDTETIYTTQDIGNYNQYSYQDYDWNNQDDEEVSEWCETLVSGGQSTPVDISSCGQYANGYNQYDYNTEYYNSQYQQYYDEYAQEGEENAQYQYMYDWYRFEINEEDALEMTTVCSLIKSNSGAMHTFYNSENGNMYDYSSGASDQITEFLEGSDSDVTFVTTSSMSAIVESLSGGAKFLIVAGTGVAVGAMVALWMRFRSSGVDSKTHRLYEDDDSDDVVESSRGDEVAFETEYTEQVM